MCTQSLQSLNCVAIESIDTTFQPRLIYLTCHDIKKYIIFLIYQNNVRTMPIWQGWFSFFFKCSWLFIGDRMDKLTNRSLFLNFISWEESLFLKSLFHGRRLCTFPAHNFICHNFWALALYMLPCNFLFSYLSCCIVSNIWAMSFGTSNKMLRSSELWYLLQSWTLWTTTCHIQLGNVPLSNLSILIHK